MQFLIEKENGDTLFISGNIDDDFEVIGHNTDYETHYNVVNAEEQVQIYEMVMADVNDDVTTVLERAKYLLKDNRLPPAGFVTEHPSYDTVRIVGLAEMDENFNKESNVQGNGSDHIFYHIPLDEYNEKLIATCKIYYQTAPPKWMKEMFDEETEEIDVFREMFNNADRNPILLKTKSIEIEEIIVGIQETGNAIENTFLVNNFSNEGIFKINSNQIHDITVYDLKGQLILQKLNQSGVYQIKLNSTKGLYLVTFSSQTGDVITKKIIYQ